MLIRTPRLTVSVLPEIGGKIAQIHHRPSGIDLLMPPQRPYRTLAPERPWVEYDTSGMDDCFPNVDEGPYPAEPWQGVLLPQLGEWVRGEWQTVSAGDTEVVLERTGSLLPYVARKRVGFAGDNALRIDYELRNTGRHGFRYIWSAHPLISAGGEFTLRLPAGELECVTFPAEGSSFRWPSYKGTDLSSEWVREGENLKVFLSGLSAGWCELATAGRRLRFDFDLARVPVLGIWFNNYGFAGGNGEVFRCIAVEPCTSPTDVLHALPVSAYPFLAAESAVAWWLTITVD